MNPDPGRLRFERMALPLQEDLYRAARALTPSDADALDLVQETYLRACRGFANYKEEFHFKAWIFTILRNTHIDLCRRRGSQPALESVETSGTEAPAAVPDVLPEEMTSALGRLKPGQHLLLLLREVQGFSYKEIAEIMGIPIGSVMSGLHHARTALRIDLAKKAGVKT